MYPPGASWGFYSFRTYFVFLGAFSAWSVCVVRQATACLLVWAQGGRQIVSSQRKKGGGLDAGLSISGVVFRAGVAEVCLLAELVGVSK